MIIVEYDSKSIVSISDGGVADLVDAVIKEFKRKGAQHIRISTETVVDEFRLRVLKDEIKHTDIEFSFKGTRYAVNEYGNMKDNPEGFCDINDKRTCEIVRLQSQKRMQERRTAYPASERE